MSTAPDTSMTVIPMNDNASIAPLSLSPSITHLEDLVKIAKLAKASSLCNIKSESDALVILMTGVELGLQPMQALQGIYAVNNRPTLSAQMMAAVIQRSPVCELFMVRESTSVLCVVEVRRKGWPESQTFSFSKEDAETARLWGQRGPWSSYPTDMLRSRAISRAARAAFSDCLLGLYTPEEAEQIGQDERSHLKVVEPAPRQRSTKDEDPEVDFDEAWATEQFYQDDDEGERDDLIAKLEAFITEAEKSGMKPGLGGLWVTWVCAQLKVTTLHEVETDMLHGIWRKMKAEGREGRRAKFEEKAAAQQAKHRAEAPAKVTVDIADPAIVHEVKRYQSLIKEAMEDGATKDQARAYAEHVQELFEVESMADMTAAQLQHVNGKLAALMPDERAGYLLRVTEGVADDVILPMPEESDRQAEVRRWYAIAGEPFKLESIGGKDTAEDYRVALKMKWGVESFNDVEVSTIVKSADALKALDLKARNIHMVQLIKEVAP